MKPLKTPQHKPPQKTCGDFGGIVKGIENPNNGKPCKRVAGHGTDHLGEGRCKFHGGNFNGPPATTGLRSNMAPVRIQEKMDRLMADENLMDLTFESALVRAQLEVKLEDIRDGALDMEQNWQDAKDLYEISVSHAGDPNGLRAFAELGKLLRGQRSTKADWDQANALVELRAKLSIAFGRNLRDQNLMVPVHEVQMYILRVTSILNEELEGYVDESRLNRIASRIEAFS